MSFELKGRELHVAQTGAPSLAALVSASTDLTLVLDRADIITDLSHSLDSRAGASLPSWRGAQIETVVQAESRATLRDALRRTRQGRSVGRFDISHSIGGGRDLPMQYSALGIGDDGVMLMGRDLRPVSDLRSALLANRHAMDETADSLRQAEAQYRLLFETSSDAVIIVDAASGKVREANARALDLLGIGPTAALSRKFASLFGKAPQADVKAMLAGVADTGESAKLRIDSGENGPLTLSARLFRAGDLRLTMVRISTEADEARGGDPANDNGLETLVRNAAEAIVLTDDAGIVVWANDSFLALAAIPVAAHAVGRAVGDFLNWSGVERKVLLDNVKRHGRVRSFSGSLRGENGQSTEVDVSAIEMRGSGQPGLGFVMRAVERGAGSHSRANSDLTRAAEKLVEMVGRVPMKDLVRDTTDVIERMCIEAALKLTGNNRASTARVLGLSRQALYLKMHRFGLADEP